jgi:hypothetical protein
LSPMEPAEKEPAEIVTFRCPPEDLEWLTGFVKGKTKLSKVTAWAVGLGREYYEALKGVSERIEAIATLEGMGRGKVVADLLAEALQARDREKRGKK